MPPRMMRSICAALCAAALLSAGAARAQTAVLYGLLDASGSYIKPVGSDDHLLHLTDGNMQKSFIGLRGSEDLGGGASVVRSAGDVLEPEAVADIVADAIAEERFLILPHPQVHQFMQRKADDPDRWLAGMRKLQARVLG